MRVLIGCLLLLVAPAMGVVAYKEYESWYFERQRLGQIEETNPNATREVLFFNASWCGPCRQMKPIVAQLRSQGYRLRDIDVDRNRSLAQQYGIRSIPTFVFVRNGSEVKRFSGGTSPDQLKKLCSNYR